MTEVELQLPDSADLEKLRSEDPRARLQTAIRCLEQLDSAATALRRVRNSAAAELNSQGRTYREIGNLVDVSPQRVSQFVNEVDAANEVIRAWAGVESKLWKLALEMGLSTNRPLGKVIDALRASNSIDSELASDIHRLLAARNRGAHGGVISVDEAEDLTEAAIWISARLQSLATAANTETMTDARVEAEALLARVRRELPERDWRRGRCDECGRAIPVPDAELWVCSDSCMAKWRKRLYTLIDPHSVEETMTRTPSVVPYWI